MTNYELHYKSVIECSGLKLYQIREKANALSCFEFLSLQST